MTRIKICGIKEETQAVAAAEAGADLIGLVFARSPRRVTIQQAEKIAGVIKSASRTVQVVGVFVNIPDYVVNRIANVCCLDWVQLSGDESWEYCSRINRPVIKVVRPEVGQDAGTICAALAAGTKQLNQEHIILFDSAVKGKYGGSGVSFDWTLAQQAATQFRVIVAGGLSSENVAGAIKAAMPWGVDVSSGVETEGTKDKAKIEAFIQAVRRADAQS